MLPNLALPVLAVADVGGPVLLALAGGRLGRGHPDSAVVQVVQDLTPVIPMVMVEACPMGANQRSFQTSKVRVPKITPNARCHRTSKFGIHPHVNQILDVLPPVSDT